MSIDNIHLTSYLCSQMFAKSLISVNSLVNNDDRDASGSQSQKKAIKSSSPSNISSLGENKGNILFLVNDSNNKFLADEEMKLLLSLLTACKISMEDIALVNYHQHSGTDYLKLSDQFQCKKMLLFGVNSSDVDLPFTIPFFQPQKFQEQLYMISPPLSDFQNNKELKMELWNCLKKIFPR